MGAKNARRAEVELDQRGQMVQRGATPFALPSILPTQVSTQEIDLTLFSFKGHERGFGPAFCFRDLSGLEPNINHAAIGYLTPSFSPAWKAHERIDRSELASHGTALVAKKNGFDISGVRLYGFEFFSVHNGRFWSLSIESCDITAARFICKPAFKCFPA